MFRNWGVHVFETVLAHASYWNTACMLFNSPLQLFGNSNKHNVSLVSPLDCCYPSLHFQAPVRIGVIFKQLRALIDTVLQQKLENPKMSLEGTLFFFNYSCNYRIFVLIFFLSILFSVGPVQLIGLDIACKFIVHCF